MNESEPLMKCRYVQMLSKPRNERLFGMSLDVIWNTDHSAAGIEVA